MPWVWSDELADRLVEQGVAESPDTLVDVSRPVAYMVDDPENLWALARDLLGLTVVVPAQ